jgi:glycerol kinase
LGPICQRRNSGITRGNDQRSHICATLEGAYQVYDLAKSMEADFGEKEKIKSRWRSSYK